MDTATKNDSKTDQNAEEEKGNDKPKNIGSSGQAQASEEAPTTTPSRASNDQARPSSPDANCSICLSTLENKSFTDSCLHQFCFVCLLEWSKVKAECPLCKQAFKSIIHNVRSLEDYDQYHLGPSEAELRARARFRYRTTMTDGNSFAVRQRQMERERMRELLQRPSRTAAHLLWRQGRQAATSDFRRRIYHRHMRVQQMRSPHRRSMRYRDVSAQFFKRNPACCHRLVPWLNRELNVLLRNAETRVQFALELILDLIKRFEIKSAEFKQHLQSILHERTSHFIHEFYNFARSPYDMISYDKHAVYNDPRSREVEELSSGSERDEVIPDLYSSSAPALVDLVSPTGVNAPAPPRPIVLDSSVIVLDSDDEEVQPSTSSGRQLRSRQRRSRWDNDVSTQDPAAPAHVPPPPLATFTPALYQQPLPDIAGPSSSSWDDPLPSMSSVWSMPSVLSDLMSAMQRSYGGSDSSRLAQASSNSPVAIDSDVDSIASSHSSDLLVTAVEKPWDDRSPIPLSSDNDVIVQEDRSTARQKKKKKKSKKSSSRDESRENSRRSRSKERSSKEREHQKSSKGKESSKHKSKNSRRKDKTDAENIRDLGVENSSRNDKHYEKRKRQRLLSTSSESDKESNHKKNTHHTSKRRRTRSRSTSGSKSPYAARRGRFLSREDLMEVVHNWMDDIPAIASTSATASTRHHPATRQRTYLLSDNESDGANTVSSGEGHCDDVASSSHVSLSRSDRSSHRDPNRAKTYDSRSLRGIRWQSRSPQRSRSRLLSLDQGKERTDFLSPSHSGSTSHSNMSSGKSRNESKRRKSPSSDSSRKRRKNVSSPENRSSHKTSTKSQNSGSNSYDKYHTNDKASNSESQNERAQSKKNKKELEHESMASSWLSSAENILSGASDTSQKYRRKISHKSRHSSKEKQRKDRQLDASRDSGSSSRLKSVVSVMKPACKTKNSRIKSSKIKEKELRTDDDFSESESDTLHEAFVDTATPNRTQSHTEVSSNPDTDCDSRQIILSSSKNDSSKLLNVDESCVTSSNPPDLAKSRDKSDNAHDVLLNDSSSHIDDISNQNETVMQDKRIVDGEGKSTVISPNNQSLSHANEK